MLTENASGARTREVLCSLSVPAAPVWSVFYTAPRHWLRFQDPRARIPPSSPSRDRPFGDVLAGTSQPNFVLWMLFCHSQTQSPTGPSGANMDIFGPRLADGPGGGDVRRDLRKSETRRDGITLGDPGFLVSFPSPLVLLPRPHCPGTRDNVDAQDLARAPGVRRPRRGGGGLPRCRCQRRGARRSPDWR